jgi:hypothetical protein
MIFFRTILFPRKSCQKSGKSKALSWRNQSQRRMVATEQKKMRDYANLPTLFVDRAVREAE